MNANDGYHPLCVATFDSAVVGYDKRSGATLWKHTIAAKKAELGARPRPLRALVRGGLVLVLAGCSNRQSKRYAEITALDASNGRVLWSHDIDRKSSGFSATLVLDDHMAIVFHYDWVGAFALSTGQLLWQRLSEHGAGGLYHPDIQAADASRVWTSVC